MREIAVAGLALLAFLLLPSSVLAAPALSVEIDRFPAQINRGDESIRFEVAVGNSSALDPTSGTLSLDFSLAPGLTLMAASGADWDCSPDLLSCESSTAVPAGSSFPLLSLSSVWIDEMAPDTVHVGVIASGGGAGSPVSAEDSFTFGPAAPFGLLFADALVADEAGATEAQAGAHPYEVSGAFETSLRRGSVPGSLIPAEDLHGGVTELPAGLIASLQAASAVCDFAALEQNECPDAAAVGGVKAFMEPKEMPPGGVPNAESPKDRVVYRLRGEEGFPATFGFKTEGLAYVMRFRLRSDGDYGLSQVFPLIPQTPTVNGISFSFCGYGVKFRSTVDPEFDRCMRRPDPGANPVPFLTLATSCADGPPVTRFAVDSWVHRGRQTGSGLPDLTDPNWSVLEAPLPPLTGCEQLTEEWTGVDEPTFGFQADSLAADSPVAYTANLHIPQDGLEDPDGLATSHLKGATISFPPGVSLNTATADGLQACSAAQIGLLGSGFPAPNRIRFDARLPNCPPASRIGTASLDTPLFEAPLGGSIFLAAQKANPFGSDYAIYVAIEAPAQGVVAKLPVKLDLDPGSGQITATLLDGPQLPIEDLELRFFGGSRAALASPVTCGAHLVSTALTPWSAADPDHPRPDEIARPADEVSIASGPNGSPCPGAAAERPFGVEFSAGSSDPVAGASSPFTARLTRPDGAQELDRFEFSPPAGFSAALRGVPYCPEAGIAAARASTGRAEQGAPSCPAAAQVGSTSSGAGAGASPFYLPGRLYLAGPYKDAPLSLVAITPALAGPFDLGNLVVRSALAVDPSTARATATSDPLPRVVGGIPLRIRDLRIALDRPGFGRNPTSCDAASVDATAVGSGGARAGLSNRFQVGECGRLAFRPKLSLRLGGSTGKSGHPSLTARLTQPRGQANVGRVAIVLPATQYLEQRHIRGVCTRSQFARRACPARSVYGRAEVESPSLDQPLKGPVYLRSSAHDLPDLVVALRGQRRQPLEINVVGRVDSVGERIRIRFGSVPDVPVSRFVLRMQGGRKGLLVNNTRLCRSSPRAAVKLVGQNGKASFRTPAARTDC